MLGIKLRQEDETRLTKFAREAKRPKSVMAREWILERLAHEEIDTKIANAAILDARERGAGVVLPARAMTDAWLRWLDAEDGGYDWGPDGPPASK